MHLDLECTFFLEVLFQHPVVNSILRSIKTWTNASQNIYCTINTVILEEERLFRRNLKRDINAR